MKTPRALWSTLLATAVVSVAAVWLTGADTKPKSKASKGPAEWPQWRGPNRDGIAADQGLLKKWPEGGPKQLWETKGMGRGFSSCSVRDGRVYTLGDVGNEEKATCVDTKNGEIIWSVTVGGNLGDGPRSTPTLDGEEMYFVTPHGEVICLALADGAKKWSRHLEKDFGGRMHSSWKFSESPLVDGDRVVVTPGAKDAVLVCLNKKDGQEIWRSSMPDIGNAGGDGAAYSSVMISNAAGVKQYVQLVGRGLIGVRADNGVFLWGYNRIANGTANIPTPIIKGDDVFCSTGYGTGAALVHLSKDGDSVKAEEVWFLKGNDLQNHHGGMVLIGDHIYGGHGHNNGFPVCVEMKTGKIVWNQGRGPGKESAAVIAADGNLVFRYQDGVTALIKATPKGYEELGAFQGPHDGASWAQPVVAGGRLYLREQDRLVCYDLRSK